MLSCLSFAVLLPFPLFADDDPFGSGDDPFATRKISATEAKLADLERQNELLKRKLQSYDQRFDTVTGKSNQMFVDMLNSSNERFHVFALENMDVLTCEWKTVAGHVKRLASSTNATTKQLAIRTLIKHDAAEARKMGYQDPKHIWLPLNLDEQSESMLHYLVNEDYSADYDETPLAEFVEVLQDEFRVNVKLHSTIDPETPITYQVRGVKLEHMLRDFAAKYEWKVIVQDQMLKIVPKTFQEESTLLVYNVAGLVQSRGMNIDRLVEYLTKNVAGDGSISSIGNMQFSCKAPMSKQIEIGKALAALHN